MSCPGVTRASRAAVHDRCGAWLWIAGSWPGDDVAENAPCYLNVILGPCGPKPHSESRGSSVKRGEASYLFEALRRRKYQASASAECVSILFRSRLFGATIAVTVELERVVSILFRSRLFGAASQ